MYTPEEHALIAEVSDRLLELYVKRDDARREGDWQRAHELQNAIDGVSEERWKVIKAVE